MREQQVGRAVQGNGAGRSVLCLAQRPLADQWLVRGLTLLCPYTCGHAAPMYPPTREDALNALDPPVPPLPERMPLMRVTLSPVSCSCLTVFMTGMPAPTVPS